MKLKNVADIYSLSPTQQGILFHARYEPDAASYFIQWVAHFTGQLDQAALQQAWQIALERHAILRTCFLWEGLDAPLQVVRQRITLPWSEVDWRDMAPTEQQQQLDALLHDQESRGFDLTRAPLMRFHLVRIADDAYTLIWCLHHILLDGWSISLLLREIFTVYRALVAGQVIELPQTRPYHDFITWLKEQSADHAAQFWRETLRGFTAATPLSIDQQPPSRQIASRQFTDVQQTLGAEATVALQRFARMHRLTLGTLIHAAWGLLLSRYSRQTDVLFGSVVAGRPLDITGADTMIGLFVNTLPIRIQIHPDAPLVTWLSELQDQLADMRQYEQSPLVDVQGWSEVARGQPMFESLLSIENYGTDIFFNADIAPGLALDQARIIESTNYPLTICVTTGTPLTVKLIYDTRRFTPDSVQRMAEHLAQLLTTIPDNANQLVGNLPLLTQAEQKQIAAWNTRTAPYPAHQTIHELVAAQCARTPDAAAAIYAGHTLSYRELDQRSDQLAQYLQKLGIGPDVPVAISVERSLDMMVGLLGILKAGGVYAPLDPSYPHERLTLMLEDMAAPILLTQAHLRDSLPPYTGQIICLDTDWPTIAQMPGRPVTPTAHPDHLAYLLYTSGSTGRPKGVAMPHRPLVNLLAWQLQNWTQPSAARTLQFASLNFDVSFQEIFSTWCAGGTLVLIDEQTRRDMLALLDLMRREQVERVFLPFVALNHMAEMAELQGTTPYLREIITAGEQLQITAPIMRLIRNIGNCVLHNQYGPTESHVVTSEQLTGDSETWPALPPIGQPITNAQIYLLDAQRQAVPIGVPGEIYIGGNCLARGYLNRPELTAERFVEGAPDLPGGGGRIYRTGDLGRYLPDGRIQFLGRIDNQVKVRGFRVELGEIEALLRQHPAVSQAAVIAYEPDAQPDSAEDQRPIRHEKLLAAYVALGAAQAVEPTELRRFLQVQVPDYMLPTSITLLDALPLLPNGKLNRRALPIPDAPRSEATFTAPQTPVEKQLASIWADVLHTGPVGIHDNFFDLGGHSLIAAQLVMRVNTALQTKLELRELFETPTVAGFAARIEATRKPSPQHNTSGLDLQAEAVLDPRIIVPASTQIAQPCAILLTGATGFVGAFLLHELLTQTEAKIYCLVRATSKDDGMRRIEQILQHYQIWDEHQRTRIVPIPGNLAQPLLGITPEQFAELANTIDVIYHSGALVNFIYPYAALKPANVLGTQEILRLATTGRTKPVHHISTISVVARPQAEAAGNIDEDDGIGYNSVIESGYIQSKLVAEGLVAESRARGLPAWIYRPGRILGHSLTGAGNADDFLMRLIIGCVQLGVAPEIDMYENLLPVDYLAQAIIHLSQHAREGVQAFHLISEQPTHFSELVAAARSLGYSLQVVPYAAWRTELLRQAGARADHALAPLLSFFPANLTDADWLDYLNWQHVGCQNAAAGIAGSGIKRPTIDIALLARSLSFLLQHARVA